MILTIYISETGNPEDTKLYAYMNTDYLPEPIYQDTFEYEYTDGWLEVIENEFRLADIKAAVNEYRNDPNLIIDICLEPCDKCSYTCKLDLGDLSTQGYRNVHALYCTNCGAIEEVVEYIE